MVTTEITVSKREFIFACLWACRHGLPDVYVYTDYDGFVFLDTYLTQFGSRCVNLGTADVSAYCDDIESDSASDQVIENMDVNDGWDEIARKAAEDYDDKIVLNWVD